ncbi:MAG: alpha/beta fold hydrolase [Deltaproteobacteria bacterium]
MPQLHEPDRPQTTEPASSSAVSARSTPTTGAAPAEGGCPPPLEWQEVLREFHQQADAWYHDRKNYRIVGRSFGSGPPLYLLNGFSGTHELHALLVWLLRDRYRCVLFDYATPPARGHVTLTDLADDLIAVADAAGDRRFDVFAPLFGGLVAMDAMGRHPDRIGRGVLQGAFAHRSLSRLERLLIRLCDWNPGKLRHLPLRGILQTQSHRRWFPPFDRTRWQFLFDNTGSVPLAEMARRAAIVRDCDLRPVLKEIRQPILLVRTEGEGKILEECCPVLASGLPHAKVEWMSDTGHFPYLTHPHRLAKVIDGFFAAGQARNPAVSVSPPP